MRPQIFRLLSALLVLIVGLSAEGQAQISLPNIQTPSLNLLRLDRIMAPGLTVGAETGLKESGYHMGYVQATIPLKGRLAIGLDLGKILEIRQPWDVVEVLKPDIRQRFVDVGVRTGQIYDTDLSNEFSQLEVYAGVSGLRYVGHRSFLVWGLRARFSESFQVFDEFPATPRVGVRAQSTLGYARFAKAGLLWYAGAYLAWDDGQWTPIPWAGFQARHPKGHRIRLLLPRELQYRYRFGKKRFLQTAPWEIGAQARFRMQRHGIRPVPTFFVPYPSRSNVTLWEGSVGGWVGHHFKNSRLWLQLHGGWVPFRRVAYEQAPGSTWVGGTSNSTPEAAFAWEFLDIRPGSAGQFETRPYLEIRLVADLGKDWLGLDLGKLLMP